MDIAWTELINIFFRFAHVLAAIMWIGDSLLFTWMEFNLISAKNNAGAGKPDDPDLMGSMDMLHGGGVYHLEKRILHADAIPAKLHWFKWQAYTTWLTGFVLLGALFWSNGSTLVDATKTTISPTTAVLFSVAGLFGGWLVYDSIWRSPLGKKPALAVTLSLLSLCAAAWFYAQFFNGRALFLQVGAMMGTFMAANVFVVIMGNQHKFMRSLYSGQAYDPKYGAAAKARSMHNHYMTFPVLFLMLSAHFPSLYAGNWNAPVVMILIIGLMTVKYLMNARYRFKHWLLWIFATVAMSAHLIGIFLHLPSPGVLLEGAAPPDPAVVAGRNLFISQTCATCHMQGSAQLGPSLQNIMATQVKLADGSSVIVDDAYLRNSILRPASQVVEGYAPVMPPFEGKLDDEQLSNLVAYIRSLSGTSVQPRQ
ncbi:MAG: hypothetical protein RIQ71_739 [Verrucomicrobiota bacterium]